jgi:tetratricopeptide (TPR) repeat protein
MAAPPTAVGRFFISYRRDEAAQWGLLLSERLAAYFGGGQIFKDVDSIQLGDNYAEMLANAIASCNVLLAIIGDRWLTITDSQGRRRLEDPDDFVRQEIETAFTYNVTVIPVLVGGARMPHEEELPSSLTPLLRYQAAEISENRLDADIEELLKRLESIVAGEQVQSVAEQQGNRPATASPPAADLLERARVLLARTEYSQALKMIEEALSHDPDSQEALLLQATVLLEVGRPEDALQVVDETITRYSNSREASSLRVRILEALEDAEEAPEAVDTTGPAQTSSPRAELKQHVRWMPDEPAGLADDHLSRTGVARALVAQLHELAEAYPGRSFLIHVDGPWGAGKSTLLRFVRELVDRGPHPWLVVSFDAWRQSRVGPPWLTLLHTVRTAVRRTQQQWWRRAWFWLAERLRLLSPWQKMAALVWLLATSAAVAAFYTWGDNLTLQGASDFVKLLGGLVVLGGTGWALATSLGRLIALDSRRAARVFEETRADPMEDLARHFTWVLGRAKTSMLVLIDDLDRCDQDYVVELLDAVQKLMRDRDIRTDDFAPTGDNSRIRTEDQSATTPGLFFVVAADGRWIRHSYEAAHATFADTVSEPGRSLGSLFVEKLFQLTVPVPQLSESLKAEYLTELLNASTRDNVRQPNPSLAAELRRAPRAQVLNVLAHADPLERVKASDIAIERLVTEPGAQEETGHSLEPFAPLLEPSPRAMKRFVMAFSMLRAVRTAEGSVVALEPLALWTALRSRWPLLAEYLQQYPEAVRYFRQPSSQLPASIPAAVAPLFAEPSDELRAVMNHECGPLDAATIRDCIGQMAHMRLGDSETEEPTDLARATEPPERWT